MLGEARKAFTLIEALVVLAIIGLVVALLLPAIQSAREAARRIQCGNNLKQFGVALNAYEATYWAFPANSGFTGYSPHTMMLPFLEQGTIYSSLNFNLPSSDSSGSNDTASRTSIAAFLCPSDIALPPNGTNYAGNTGIGVQKYGFNGIIAPTPVGYRSLIDGASQTAAFSETVLGKRNSLDPRRTVYSTPSHLTRPEEFDRFTEECRGLKTATAEVVYEMRGSTWIGSDFLWTLYNHANPLNSNSCAINGFLSQGAWLAGSLHSGGGNVLFADGHVKFIKQSINLNTWRAIGSRAGGEIANFE